MAAGALESELAMKRSELQALFMEIKDMEERVGAAGGNTLGAGGMSGESPEIQLVRVNQQLMQAFEVNDSLESRLEVAQNLLTAKEVELANTKAELLQYKQRSEDLASKVDRLEKLNESFQNELQMTGGDTSGAGPSRRSAVRRPGASEDENKYFFLINELEDKIREKDAKISELFEERKALDIQLKRRDAAIDQLTSELQEHTKSYEDVAVLDGQIRELLRTIDHLEKERQLLDNISKNKTQTIEKLQHEVTLRSHAEEYVRQLEASVRSKEKVIEEAEDHVGELEKKVSDRDKQIDKLARAVRAPTGLNFEEWYNERKGLHHEIQKLTDSKNHQNRIIKSQNERINQLAGRLDTLARSLNDTAHLSPRHAAMMVTPQRPGGGVFVDEDGQELIAAELFDALARDVHILKIKLEEKDQMLLEKDDVVECWERKNRMVEDTSSKKVGNLKNEVKRLKAEVRALQNEQAKKEAVLHTFKERETQLRMTNTKLKQSVRKRSQQRRRDLDSSTGSAPGGSGSPSGARRGR